MKTAVQTSVRSKNSQQDTKEKDGDADGLMWQLPACRNLLRHHRFSGGERVETPQKKSSPLSGDVT